MQIRFLIDENLTPRLTDLARTRGYAAVHVNHLGLRTRSDRTLMRVVRANDYTLVTNNVAEFRARYDGEELHAGIVLIVPAVPLVMQLQLFAAALDSIDADSDLINQAIELRLEAGHIVIDRYVLP